MLTMPRPAFTTPAPVRTSVSANGTHDVCGRTARSCRFATGRRRAAPTMTASTSRDEARKLKVGDVRITAAESDTDNEDVFQLWESLGVSPDEADESHESERVLGRDASGKVVATGRLVREGTNVQLSRVYVEEEMRGRGIGKKVVEQLMAMAAPIQGALFVEARRGELGFYSLLGFETQGFEYMEGREMFKHMVYRFPVCAPSNDCVGLHHTSIRVSDIEASLAWYGSVGFTVSEKFFTPAGSRACFVEGLGVRLELVESTTGVGISGVQDWPGFLVFDVTRGCSDLDSFLENLSKQNGGSLTVTKEPMNQVVGTRLLSTCTVEDPDGLPIEFLRREGSVPTTLLRRVDW